MKQTIHTVILTTYRSLLIGLLGLVCYMADQRLTSMDKKLEVLNTIVPVIEVNRTKIEVLTQEVAWIRSKIFR